MSGALLLTLAAGLVVLTDEAQAAGPCDGVDFWTELRPVNPYMVPTDGVLLLSLRSSPDHGTSDADALGRVALNVTLDDLPIAGALELTDVPRVIAWRPAAPLAAGGYYVVDARLDNSPESDAAGCAPDTLDALFTMIVEAGPAAPLNPPVLVSEVRVDRSLSWDLPDLVCCDGARPVDPPEQGSAPGFVYWTTGHCESLLEWVTMDVSVEIAHDLPPPSAALVARRFVEDGVPGPFALELDKKQWRSRSRPFCHGAELKNLATGATATSEVVCHGEDIPDLGTNDHDPSAELAERCRGPAQTCEAVAVVEHGEEMLAWDLEQCTPWPPEVVGQHEEGRGCAVGSGGAPGWVALLVLRRRRRGRFRAGPVR